MKCPHCRVEFRADLSTDYIGSDVDGHWAIISMKCPNEKCDRLILQLVNGEASFTANKMRFIAMETIEKQFFVYPKTSSRPPCPSEVPLKYSVDYGESCLVLSDSPKASAALSRRCLQNMLRDVAGVKPSTLNDEIEEILNRGNLPSHIADSIDGVRNIGNFAAHPIKSRETGEILDVEPGEAEWNLDVLESLFDFYFVQPAKTKAKKDALNKKLKAAGKKPMK